MLTVGVIGLGLIGGSILKGLKDKEYNLVGESRSPETVKSAFEQGLISSNNIDKADVIFICTPINKTINTIKDLAGRAKPGAIITDAASIKGFIMDFVNNNPEPINFIGGHPMAGTEHKGLDASIETLYEGAKWVLTPSKWQSDTKIIEKIITDLGAAPVIAEPAAHDRAVALISHMPLFLSKGLLSFVQEHPEQELAMTLAASGFRSMTRLAHTNPELAADMLAGNKENIMAAMDQLINHLQKWKESV